MVSILAAHIRVRNENVADICITAYCQLSERLSRDLELGSTLQIEIYARIQIKIMHAHMAYIQSFVD